MAKVELQEKNWTIMRNAENYEQINEIVCALTKDVNGWYLNYSYITYKIDSFGSDNNFPQECREIFLEEFLLITSNFPLSKSYELWI